MKKIQKSLYLYGREGGAKRRCSRLERASGNGNDVDNKFLIPGIEFGNVFVGIQPARPPLGESDLAKAAHNKTKPPHHQYIAFYFWLQEVWGADAVFHVGTHGLAEFMKLTACSISAVFFP